jgi:hypothetical protein
MAMSISTEPLPKNLIFRTRYKDLNREGSRGLVSWMVMQDFQISFFICFVQKWNNLGGNQSKLMKN